MVIDTHSHLNFNAYKKDLDEVIKRTLDNNIWVINVGSKYETSKKAVEIAEKYGKGVFAAVGLHPIYASADIKKANSVRNKSPEATAGLQANQISNGVKTDPEEGDFLIKEEIFDKEKYKELAKSDKVVAIGEIGLDYYYKPKTTAKLDAFKQKQKEVFLEQLELAKELDLPVILHCRMAHSDLIDILKKFQVLSFKFQGVIHCFTGSWEEAKQYMDLGFYIGINGIIFKMDLDKIIKETPLDKILVETDCPYLLPSEALAKEGLTGITRNEPIFIKHVIQKIAELKGISFQEVVDKTTQNARKVFSI